MDAGTGVAIVAALIAAVATYYNFQSARAARIAARAAEEQTRIQRSLRIDAAQPYVWADVRPDDESGFLLTLMVGNSGPTIAQNVHVKIEPPLPTIEQLKESAVAQARLAESISSLPPGRTHTWTLGQGFNLLQADGPQQHTFTITADGPFGQLPPTKYVIDLADWRGQPARASGTLGQVAKAIDKLSDKISKDSRQ